MVGFHDSRPRTHLKRFLDKFSNLGSAVNFQNSGKFIFAQGYFADDFWKI